MQNFNFDKIVLMNGNYGRIGRVEIFKGEISEEELNLEKDYYLEC